DPRVNAKAVTRSVLERALNDPMFLLTMAANGVTPGDIEIIVKEIIEYLEKTKQEAEG
ncbi:unnamed protein product, partial [marine sediment metagenome]